ncbi:hypothetical protein BKA59DRAFT_448314 [Fusarium tricinctum]|uniref:Uncharacterized protein n=1 Tax=Fusarium tricinctum TaxID=61284 RepID=A0A8K0SBZ5_9HYPO|nr:hypothetical protein BKA59DRAFT_448314 [Fusarium tricinctum]
MRITVRCDAMRHNKEMRAVSRRAILGVALLAGGIASMDEDCERIRLRKKTSEMTLWATKGKSPRSQPEACVSGKSLWLSCKSSRKGRGQRFTGRSPGFSKQNRTEVPEWKAEVDRRVRIAPHKSVIAGGFSMAEQPTRDE